MLFLYVFTFDCLLAGQPVITALMKAQPVMLASAFKHPFVLETVRSEWVRPQRYAGLDQNGRQPDCLLQFRLEARVGIGLKTIANHK
jgi:hypothetical protein